MKKTAIIISTLTFFVFATAGCNTDYRRSTNDNIVKDIATPLSCDKTNNMYYDFIETKKCIRPVTHEQLYILDKFRFFNQLAMERPNEVVKIRVGFREYLDAATYENLIVKEGKIAEIKSIDLYYPDLDENGLGGEYQPRSGEVVTREGMLQAADKYHRYIFSLLYRDPATKTDPIYAQEDMQNFGIAIVEVTMNTSDITTWWDQNKAVVRYIQPLITDIDPIQTPYYPSIPIVPRGFMPEIDWDNQK